ncbi:hypothetical protein GOODEAATRI_025531 [Goodea atripinnis]|uniref:Uncharacterized protein n=1 Tax=Goodea atripinnis TaxID=208336 RepID=A0ABV0PRK6_9TELE
MPASSLSFLSSSPLFFFYPCLYRLNKIPVHMQLFIPPSIPLPFYLPILKPRFVTIRFLQSARYPTSTHKDDLPVRSGLKTITSVLFSLKCKKLKAMQAFNSPRH